MAERFVQLSYADKQLQKQREEQHKQYEKALQKLKESKKLTTLEEKVQLIDCLYLLVQFVESRDPKLDKRRKRDDVVAVIWNF